MNYPALIKAINTASTQLQGRAAAAVNQALVIRNWLIGAYLVEFEQSGKDRAKYGARLLETLAKDLSTAGARGFTAAVLRSCRLTYSVYPQIRQTVSVELLDTLGSAPIRPTLPVESPLVPSPVTRQKRSAVLSVPAIRGSVSPELPTPLSPELVLSFSWSQLQELIRLDDPWKRAFFENECLKGRWSVRQLQRQIGSLLYERTGLSTDKKAVIARARKQAPRETITDLIRDPYVLEFTGLAERPEYLESDLETALLTHLQTFLLELGEGFCFEARQKRITVGRQHDYIDLVFYHRRLRCHVLVDLKIRHFRHGDAGQMNFYLNWWKANGMEPGDQPPIGIVLCSDREHAVVEFATAGLDNQLFVSRYLVALPSADTLRAFLETDRERIESLCPPPAAKPAARKRPRTP
jgi:predicted nuclease of restriction endonuclease-like (RecB) superfamily